MKKLLVASVIVIGLVLLASCGRKAPPRLPAYEQPPAPLYISAVQRGNSVILTWDYPKSKIRYVREFRVMKSEKLLASTQETSYTESDIQAGKVYDYTVFAVSSSGIVSEATAQVKVETAEVPSPPIGLKAEVVKEGVSLSWEHPREDILFNVYRSPERDLEPFLPANPEPVSGTRYTDIPYADKTVYYSVRAFIGGPARHESLLSEVLEIRPDTFVPLPPVDLSATIVGKKVLIAWKESPEVWVRSYKIYRSSNGEEFSLSGESRTPSFIDSDGVKGSLYYRVKAIGPAVESGFSETTMVMVE